MKEGGWENFLVGSTSKTTIPIIFHIFPWKLRALLDKIFLYMHTETAFEASVSHEICQNPINQR